MSLAVGDPEDPCVPVTAAFTPPGRPHRTPRGPFSAVGPNGSVHAACPTDGFRHTKADVRADCYAGATTPADPPPSYGPLWHGGHPPVRRGVRCVAVRCGAEEEWHYHLPEISPQPPPAEGAPNVVVLRLPPSPREAGPFPVPWVAHLLHHINTLGGSHAVAYALRGEDGPCVPPGCDWDAEPLRPAARASGYSVFMGRPLGCPLTGGPSPEATPHNPYDLTAWFPACPGRRVRSTHPLDVLTDFWAVHRRRPRFGVLDLTYLSLEDLEGPLVEWMKAWHGSGRWDDTALVFLGPGPGHLLLPRRAVGDNGTAAPCRSSVSTAVLQRALLRALATRTLRPIADAVAPNDR